METTVLAAHEHRKTGLCATRFRVNTNDLSKMMLKNVHIPITPKVQIYFLAHVKSGLIEAFKSFY